MSDLPDDLPSPGRGRNWRDALTPVPPPGFTDEDVVRLQELLEKAIDTGELRLSEVRDADLKNMDVAHYGRVNLVAAYLRIWHFFKRTPIGFWEANAQAKLGIAYLKHVESTDSAFRNLLLGRKDGDGVLVTKVAELRLRAKTLIETRQARAEAPAEGGNGS